MKWEKVLKLATQRDERTTPNTASQTVVNLVRNKEIYPVYYSPTEGMYKLLPGEMARKLDTVKGTDFNALYRGMRKKAAWKEKKELLDKVTTTQNEIGEKNPQPNRSVPKWFVRGVVIIAIVAVAILLASLLF
jgi:hypothetical protein